MGLSFWLTHIIIRIFLWFVWQDCRSSYIPIWIFNSDNDSLTSGASKYPSSLVRFDWTHHTIFHFAWSFHFITSFSCHNFFCLTKFISKVCSHPPKEKEQKENKRFKFLKYDLELEALVRNRIQNQPFAKFGKCVTWHITCLANLSFHIQSTIVFWWFCQLVSSVRSKSGSFEGPIWWSFAWKQIFFKQHAYIMDFVESIWWTCSCFILQWREYELNKINFLYFCWHKIYPESIDH